MSERTTGFHEHVGVEVSSAGGGDAVVRLTIVEAEVTQGEDLVALALATFTS